MIELVTDIAFGLLGLAMVLAVLRLILGPTLADRILALDLANTVGIGLIFLRSSTSVEELRTG